MATAAPGVTNSSPAAAQGADPLLKQAGPKGAGFKMDPPLDPALTATVSRSWSWPRKARHPPESNSITYTTTEFVSLSADRCNHAV